MKGTRGDGAGAADADCRGGSADVGDATFVAGGGGAAGAGTRPHRRQQVMVMQAKIMGAICGTMALSGLLAVLIARLLDHFSVLPDYARPFALPTVTVILSVILGIVIAWFLLRWLMKPVREIVDATKRVTAGDYSARVEEMDAGGEFSDLQVSFNQMVEELQGIELLRNDFINDFSHEFKTPIVSIHGFAGQLLEDDLTPEQRAEYSRIIFDESARLTELSSSVLLLSRIENQQILERAETFDLDELLRRSIVALQRRWEEKGLELALDLEPVRVQGNPDLLGNLADNLLGNAIKFSPQGAVLTVSCHYGAFPAVCGETGEAPGETPGGVAGAQEGPGAVGTVMFVPPLRGDESEREAVVIEVADRGPGMGPEVAARAFDKFFQGDASRAVQGNGIGLSIVRRVVELHDGTIELHTKPGAGSRFTVYLPA